jgi:hypothetical protein
VWVCVCVGFVMCPSFGNMCTCVYCVVLFVLCFLHCFFYVYVFLLIFSVLPQSDNAVAVISGSSSSGSGSSSSSSSVGGLWTAVDRRIKSVGLYVVD